MARHELSIEHLKKPAHQVIALIIKAIEKKVRRQRWLMLLQHHSKLDANTAPLDPEALHDFRVELRRLRVWLAQSRDCVATRRAARSQLRALAKMSNAPRDTEVFLSLLAKIPADAPKLLPATAPPAPNSHPTPLLSLQRPCPCWRRAGANKNRALLAFGWLNTCVMRCTKAMPALMAMKPACTRRESTSNICVI
ncbi:MAG: hypothetical protein B7X12_06935 [Halothiobacillus sp. 20-53-49]|nr:MAG: hypothetical protein B7X12_06935 [Halothiobacillus sp. 20-53-49]